MQYALVANGICVWTATETKKDVSTGSVLAMEAGTSGADFARNAGMIRWPNLMFLSLAATSHLRLLQEVLTAARRLQQTIQSCGWKPAHFALGAKVGQTTAIGDVMYAIMGNGASVTTV